MNRLETEISWRTQRIADLQKEIDALNEEYDDKKQYLGKWCSLCCVKGNTGCLLFYGLVDDIIEEGEFPKVVCKPLYVIEGPIGNAKGITKFLSKEVMLTINQLDSAITIDSDEARDKRFQMIDAIWNS